MNHIQKEPVTAVNAFQYLVHGYIRRIEEQFKFNIIPDAIRQLCLLFYPDVGCLICLFNTWGKFKKRIKKVAALDTYSLINSKYNVNSLQSLSYDQRQNSEFQWPTKLSNASAFCYQSNVQLPSQILKLIDSKKQNKKLYLTGSSQFDQNTNIVFQAGGSIPNFHSSRQCYAYIIDTNYTDAWQYKLPNLPKALCKSTLLFDSKIGLICFGGERNIDDIVRSVYRLQWKSVKKRKQWYWEKLTDLKEHRAQCTAIYIKQANKVMILGGISNGNVELYNMNKMKSKIIFNGSQYDKYNVAPFRRCCAGGYYDKDASRIYIGGGFGFGSGRNVTVYDIHKNKWLDKEIPQTNNVFSKHPVIWKDLNGLMYIAGNSCMESLDLRMGKSAKWNAIYSMSCESSHVDYYCLTAEMMKEKSEMLSTFGIDQLLDQNSPIFLRSS